MSNNVGVFVSRATAGPLAFGPDPGDSLFIALTANRGPINIPTLVTSFDQFTTIFGTTTVYAAVTEYSEGYEVLKVFFDKGKTSKRVYALRIVGAAAVAAYVDIVDDHGTPLDTLRVSAKGPGTWANAFDITVAAGTKASTKKITVLDGSGDTMETWDNFVMTDAAIEQVNDGSNYIVLANLANGHAAPDNLPVNGTVNLNDDQAGVDDNAPADADVVGTEAAGVKTGLKAFRDTKYGRGFLVAPGLDEAALARAECMAHYAYYRLWLTSVPEGKTAAQAITDLATGTITDWNVGYLYPRGYVEDASTENWKTISLVGHWVADWLTAIVNSGPGKAPAGRTFKADRIVRLEAQANGMPLVDATVAETLMTNGINPVWDRNGQGPKIWGAVTTSTEAAWRYLHAAYLWCSIASQVQSALDELVYDVGTPLFFMTVKMGIRNFLIDMHGNGAFNGAIPPENGEVDSTVHAFDVQCDEGMLSALDKENGVIRANIWFKPALTAETIYVEVAKMNQA